MSPCGGGASGTSCGIGAAYQLKSANHGWGSGSNGCGCGHMEVNIDGCGRGLSAGVHSTVAASDAQGASSADPCDEELT